MVGFFLKCMYNFSFKCGQTAAAQRAAMPRWKAQFAEALWKEGSAKSKIASTIDGQTIHESGP